MPATGLAGGVADVTAGHAMPSHTVPLMDALCTVRLDENVIVSGVPDCTIPETGCPVVALKKMCIRDSSGGNNRGAPEFRGYRQDGDHSSRNFDHSQDEEENLPLLARSDLSYRRHQETSKRQKQQDIQK